MPESRQKTTFARRVPDGKEESSLGKRLRWEGWARYTVVGVAALIIAILFPRSSVIKYQYEVGSIWSGDTVRAPFAFPLYKDEATYRQEVEQAESDVLPVFVPNGANTATVQDTLGALVQTIAVAQARPPYLSNESWAFIQSIAPEERGAVLLRVAEGLAEGLAGPYRGVVIDRSKPSIRANRVAIRRTDVYEEVVPITALYDSLDVLHTIEATLPRRLNPQEASLAMELFYRFYTPKYIFSPSLTEEARDNARNSVQKYEGVVGEGEVIVSTGERITDLTKLKLASYERSRQRHDVEEKPWWQLAGNLVHISILLGMALLYLYHFRRRIYRDNLQLMIMMGTVVITSFVSYLTLRLGLGLPLEFLIPMPLIAMLLVILFDSRTAFYITVTTCFIIAGVRGADYSVAFASLSAGVLAIYAVRDIKSRTQLFRSIGYSLAGYTAAIIALGLGRSESLADMGLKLGFAAINVTFSPVLTFGAIFVLERVFSIATDMKLLEYDNLSHPLLRALADKAPGTYQHTLTISRLAESAATAVGANGLLAKVGSYFHDIGKIAKAEYFVENQMGMGNKHDRIKPEKSAKIIRDHVLEGIELAREYKLPQRIIDFIPMHHGTTMIQYFLDKAREGNPDVNEKDFRYPGPLPHSRETAIVMLADAVEATTRSLPNPTPKAIEETVDRVIKKRFSEGQLDQCELTLADLTKIKGAFVRNLVGMSHPRIQYKSSGEPTAAEPMDLETRDKGRQRNEPTIPYIDDAFGSNDAEFSYGKPIENPDDDGKK